MSSSIVVQNIGKRFSIYDCCKAKTITDSALTGWPYSRHKQDFWALKDVRFTVSPSEMLGIIGKNGAGKSTLLQVVSQVISPDTGFVKVRGNIGALLDLGASLSADLTGYENIFINGMIAGLTRRQVSKVIDNVIDFSELKGFIENPVRTYSSGMKMRLAFAIAIHTSPEVLLIDEFLSVGDSKFREKCQQWIFELRQQGCAVMLVSHNAYQVKKMCSKAMWLSDGKVQDYGAPAVVVNRYMEAMHGAPLPDDSESTMPLELENASRHADSFTHLDSIKITRVELSPRILETGDKLTVEFTTGPPNG